MAGEWRNLAFTEAVLVNPEVRLERGRRYPFVDMGGVNPGARSAFATEEREFSGGGSRFQHGDTLMARITPCLENGKIARFCAPEGSGVGHGSTEFIVIRGRPGVTHSDFAYYLTQWEGVRGYAISHMTGTSGHQRVPTDCLDHLSVPIPPLSEQRAIAHILGTLDDKIELNRRMSQTLEAMARALFKAWFIDFEPVRRNAARARNQPSPHTPLPGGEKGRTHYRGGFAFSGLIETARELRRKQTPAEAMLWELLRDRRFMGLKFRRQHQLGDYVVDFYCHELRLVLELDGGIHASKRDKDHKRDAWLKARGYKVLRFPNEQHWDDPDTVLRTLADVVKSTEPNPPSPSGSLSDFFRGKIAVN
jgi:very-short-patch-repair endonuclease